MPASTDPGAAAAASRGISGEAMRLFGSLTRHFQSLLGLAGLEAREAVGTYVRAGIALVAMLLFAAFGYIFLLLTIALALAHFFHVDWLWTALAYTVLHLAAAAGAGVYAKKHFAIPVFRATAEEIRRDAAALRNNDHPTPFVP